MPTRAQNPLVCGLGATGQSLLRYLCAQGLTPRVWDSRRQPPGLDDTRRAFPAADIQCASEDWVALLEGRDEVLVSPGIAADHPLITLARSKGVPVQGDIAVFAQAVAQPIIAVTGSNGKSTVVTALTAMAQACGLRAAAGGNLGPPALDLLDGGADLFVLELSSFQLEYCDRLPLVAAAVLNISPDHLDRHHDLASYAAAKARIFSATGLAVRNADEADVMAMPGGERALSFGRDAAADFRVHQGQIWQGHAPLCSTSTLRLVGAHNHLNAAAALAMASGLGWDMQKALAGLAAFRGLPHRCEWVATQGGVTWINDSKGTNVGAMQAAIDGLEGPLVVLAGGQAKGGDFSPLRESLAKKSRRVLLYGEDAVQIRTQLGADLGAELVDDLATAVGRARELAQSGDSVLLSPGCASFDQYSGFEARGAHFRALVEGAA